LQNFIFLTVTYFGPLTCSIFTTTRKFFTILGSVLIFRHPLTTLQWTGTLLVFAGLSLDSAFGKASKPKPSRQTNSDVDVRIKNGHVLDGDTQQRKLEKVKPL